MGELCQLVEKDGIAYIYQCIHFNESIKKEYYVGDDFLNLNQEKELQTGELVDRIKDAGFYGFMPNLVQELTAIIGKENYIYDGYEFGGDEINFYFLIAQKNYPSIMGKLTNWKSFKEYEKLMWFEIKKLGIANKQF